MADSKKTRLTGLIVSATAVAASATTGFLMYINGDVRFGNIDIAGNLQAGTITGSTLDVSGTASGANLNIFDASGSGTVSIFGGNNGGSGGVLCIEDTDGAGWTLCDALNGTLTCATTTTQCPKS